MSSAFFINQWDTVLMSCTGCRQRYWVGNIERAAEPDGVRCTCGCLLLPVVKPKTKKPGTADPGMPPTRRIEFED